METKTPNKGVNGNNSFQLPPALEAEAQAELKRQGLSPVANAVSWSRAVDMAAWLFQRLVKEAPEFEADEVLEELDGLTNEGDISHWAPKDYAVHFARFQYEKMSAQVGAWRHNFMIQETTLASAHDEIERLRWENLRLRSNTEVADLTATNAEIERLRAELKIQDEANEILEFSACESVEAYRAYEWPANLTISRSSIWIEGQRAMHKQMSGALAAHIEARITAEEEIKGQADALREYREEIEHLKKAGEALAIEHHKRAIEWETEIERLRAENKRLNADIDRDTALLEGWQADVERLERELAESNSKLKNPDYGLRKAQGKQGS